MKKILLFIIAVLCSLYAMSQKETYNWAFGQRAGLTWNTTRSMNVATVNTTTGVTGTFNVPMDGLPSDLPTAIQTLEGCFSLSDNKGNLLFYSDGSTIWNKNNVPMPNGTGMYGNSSSAQSGIIMPYPGNPGKYIALSVQANPWYGIAYSIVDMTLDGGLGDLSSKNNAMSGTGSISESATAIRHANGTDFWVIAPGRGGNYHTYFNAWKVTKDGVAATPVVSDIALPSKTTVGAYGYFKISPDGKHFAYGQNDDGYRIMYGDFDTETGVISNAKQKSLATGGNIACYGVEFSPSGKLLYVGNAGVLAVIKFDELLQSSTPWSFPYKRLLIANYSGALQTGPDKRIYATASTYNSQKDYLYVIDNIEDYDNFKIYQLPSGFMSGTCVVGLPSFSSSWFTVEPPAIKTFTCSGNQSSYSVEINMSGLPDELPVKLEWDFGDGSAKVIQNIVTGVTTYNQSHTYENGGTYNITITPYREDGTALSSVEVPVHIANCVFKTNRMLRTDFQNVATKASNR